MGYCTWAGMNEANQIYHDTEWGIPYWYFPLFYARVVKFGKGTAFHKASIPVSCSRQRVRAGNAWPGDAGWRKPTQGFETHRGYYAHIAEWNRRCTKDAVPETE